MARSSSPRGGGSGSTGRDRGGPGGASRSGPDKGRDGRRKDTTAVQAVGRDLTKGPVGGGSGSTGRGPDGRGSTVSKESMNQRDDPVLGAMRRFMGLVAPGPLGVAMTVGEEMGDRVAKMQQDIDAGVVTPDKSYTDPSMGRVDVVKGRAYSYGNPASDDRAKNIGGLGKGMTGGNSGENALAAAEERRKRRAAAQQTALGSVNELLGPGVLPI